MDDEDGYSTDTREEARTHRIFDYPTKADGTGGEQEEHQAFVMARRWWRSLIGRPQRTGRFTGNGEGKGTKGKGFRRKSGWLFLSDDGDGALCPVCAEYNLQESFVMGKSKGKSLRGSNNKPMVCGNCGSLDHLLRQCDAPDSE